MTAANLTAANHFRSDLVRWQQLVCPDWLQCVLAGQPVVAAPRQGWCLLEVGCGTEALFLHSHIPTAAYLETRTLEDLPYWNKVPDTILLALLLRLGLAHDTTVILYGRNQAAAGRAAHLMLYAGVQDVRLLDGGFAAWQRAGWPCAAGVAPPPTPVATWGARFASRPEVLIDKAQVQALLASPTAVLVSIRSWAEFSGQTSGYSYIQAAGDIPGARWGRAGVSGDVNSMSAYHQRDGSLRPAAEISAFWAQEGITAERQVAFYCGTGWRASLAFFYAWLMGWENISVYDGGWYEWSSTLVDAGQSSRNEGYFALSCED
jgi:molybdopterin synthase sulfurtransferase